MFENVSFKLVKLNLLKNFAFKNLCKKDMVTAKSSF